MNLLCVGLSLLTVWLLPTVAAIQSLRGEYNQTNFAWSTDLALTSVTELGSVTLPGHSLSMMYLDFQGTTKEYIGSMNWAPTTQMTVSFWIKTTMTEPGMVVSMGRAKNVYKGQFAITVNNGLIAYYEYSTSVGLNMWSTNPINTGKWVHVVFIKNGGTGQFYIDGVAQAAKYSNNVVSLANNNFNFGCDLGENNRYFKGSISNFKLYSNALSEAQVALTHQASFLPESYYLSAQSFVGTTGFFIGPLNIFDTKIKQMTLAFWIKSTQTSLTTLVSVGRNAQMVQESFALTMNDGYVTYTEYRSDATVALQITSTQKVNTGLYVSIIVSKNGKSCALYINGVQSAVASNGLDSIKNVAGNLGSNPVDNTQFFNGELSVLHFFNMAADTNHVSLLLQETLPGTVYNPGLPPFTGNTVLYNSDISFFSGNDLTISFWMKTSQASKGVIFTIGKIVALKYKKFEVGVDNGKLRVSEEEGLILDNWNTACVTNDRVDTNKFVHVAVVRTLSKQNGIWKAFIKTYIDGVVRCSGWTYYAALTLSNTMKFGTNICDAVRTCSYYYKGDIANFRFDRIGLNEQQVAALSMMKPT